MRGLPQVIKGQDSRNLKLIKAPETYLYFFPNIYLNGVNLGEIVKFTMEVY